MNTWEESRLAGKIEGRINREKEIIVGTSQEKVKADNVEKTGLYLSVAKGRKT